MALQVAIDVQSGKIFLLAGKGGGGGSSVSFPITETQGGTNQTGYAKGDLLYASDTDLLERLAAADPGQVLGLNPATGLPAWMELPDPSRYVYAYEDFFNYQTFNSQSQNSWLGVQGSGTGVSVHPSFATPIDLGHPGINPLGTGSTSSGKAALFPMDYQTFGGGPVILEWCMYLSALSDGTDGYTLLMGFADVFNYASTPTSRGLCIEYTDTVNSGNLVLRAKNSGSSTVVSTSTPPIAAGWSKFRITVNADASLATFSLNGTVLDTITTNIPASISQRVMPYFCIQKTLGTTAVKMNLDYVKFIQVFTNAR